MNGSRWTLRFICPQNDSVCILKSCRRKKKKKKFIQRDKKCEVRLVWSGCCPVGWCDNTQLEVNSAVTESSRRSAEIAEGGDTSSICCQSVSQELSAGIKPQQSRSWITWSTPTRQHRGAHLTLNYLWGSHVLYMYRSESSAGRLLWEVFSLQVRIGHNKRNKSSTFLGLSIAG